MRELMRSVLVLNQKTILITLNELERTLGEDLNKTEHLNFLVVNLKNLSELNENLLKENRIEVEELKLEVFKVKDIYENLKKYIEKIITKEELLEKIENIKNRKVEIKQVSKNNKADLEEIFRLLRKDLVTDRVHIDMNELAEFEETEDALAFCNNILDPYLDKYFKDGIYSFEDRDEMKDRIFDIVRG